MPGEFFVVIHAKLSEFSSDEGQAVFKLYLRIFIDDYLWLLTTEAKLQFFCNM